MALLGPEGRRRGDEPAGAQRYVLKGTGTVECSDYAGGVADDEAQTVGPGSLVEYEAQTNLKWRADDFTVLTPSFEDWTEYRRRSRS